MIEAMASKAGMAEKGFTIAAFLCFADAFISPIEATLGMPVDSGNSDLIAMILFNGIYIVTAFLILPYAKEAVYILSREKSLVCLLGLVFLSTIWSDVPFLTFRRAVGISGTTLFGLYFATRYDLEEQLHLLAVVFGISATASFLIGLTLPSHGIGGTAPQDPYTSLIQLHEGAWRGAFYDKNVLGRSMVLSSIVFLLIDAEDVRFLALKWTLFCLSFALVVLSTSKTALVALLALLVLLQVYRIFRFGLHLKIALYCLGVCTIVLAILSLSESSRTTLAMLGRDETFSGRSELWSAVWNMISKRPFLGYGYNAFWVTGGKAQHVWSTIGWPAPHAHNGFLDLWLHLGLVGVLLFFGGMWRAMHASFLNVVTTSSKLYLWPLIYLTFTILYNTTESTLLANNSFFWVLYASVLSGIYLENTDISADRILYNEEI